METERITRQIERIMDEVCDKVCKYRELVDRTFSPDEEYEAQEAMDAYCETCPLSRM